MESSKGIAEIPGPKLFPKIPDKGIAVGVEQVLEWSIDPFAETYRVYFGTSKKAVEKADEDSPEFLGSTTEPSWALAELLSLDEKYLHYHVHFMRAQTKPREVEVVWAPPGKNSKRPPR